MNNLHQLSSRVSHNSDERLSDLAARFVSPAVPKPSHVIASLAGTAFPGEIRAADLVALDCTANSFTGDALYIVIFDEPSPWVGVRRLQRTPQGLMMSAGGDSAPILVTPKIASVLVIAAKIKAIYRLAEAS
jgi:hypothetical protein